MTDEGQYMYLLGFASGVIFSYSGFVGFLSGVLTGAVFSNKISSELLFNTVEECVKQGKKISELFYNK